MNIDKNKLRQELSLFGPGLTSAGIDIIVDKCEIKPKDCSKCAKYGAGGIAPIVQHSCSHCIYQGGRRDNFKPKPTKTIDLSMMVGSDIDIEASKDGVNWKVTQLKAINTDHNLTRYKSHLGNWYHHCRIRQDHWHSCNVSECPIPKGLLVALRTSKGYTGVIDFYHSQLDWNDVIAFKVIGKAHNYFYE